MHIISSENIEVYQKLKDFYDNKDFSSSRTSLESEIELKIICDLAKENSIAKQISDEQKNGNSNNYLETLKSMDLNYSDASSFLSKMNTQLNDIISIAKAK